MSQSKLVNVTILTNHIGYPDGKKGRGGKKIDKIFVHHMAGILTAKQCGNVFKSRQASAHYGIGSDGKIGQYVLEENTAWHCANKSYNQRSIGIELSNDGGAKTNWHVSDKTIAKCIDLIVDICKRNNISKINYTGDLKGNLCMHRWTASTSCPGPYLAGKFKYIAEQVNKKLSGGGKTEELYRVRKTWADAKSQVGAYKGLDNAKKVADEKGLNVYDSKGTLVYQSKKKEVVSTLYRVRKTWTDTKSQVGAYKELANAKAACDKHPGYSVYDESGKAVYTSKGPAPAKNKLVVKADEYCWPYGTSSSKYSYKKGSAKASYKTALKKYMGKSAKVSQSDCGYFVSTCVRAAGLGSKFLALPGKPSDKYPAVPSTMQIVHSGKAIPSGFLKAGDIIRYRKSSGQHTMIYYGDGKIAEAQRSNNFPAIKKDTKKYNASNVKKATIQVIRAK